MAVLTNTEPPANTSVRRKTSENLKGEQELQEEEAASDQHNDQQLGTAQQTSEKDSLVLIPTQDQMYLYLFSAARFIISSRVAHMPPAFNL